MKYLILIFTLLVALNSSATNYYFSKQSGASNSNTGTQASPFLSLNKVISGLASGDSILLRRGDVFTDSLTISVAGVTLGAYGTGAAPVISGFVNVTGWTNAGGNIWYATLNAGLRQNVVLINNKSEAPGRYPNKDGNWLRVSSHSENGDQFTVTGNLPASPSFTGGKMVQMVREWIADKGIITSHSGNTVVYNSEEKLNTVIGVHIETPSGFGYFISEQLNTLDTLNEWYYNNSNNRLYVVSSGAPTNVRAAVINNLVTVNANNVNIVNIDMEGAEENFIYAFDKQYTYINNCNFRYGGNEGIFLYQTYTPTITNCSFNWINNRAIQLIQIFGEIRATVKDNTLKNIGMFLGMGRGNNKSYEGMYIYGDSSIIRFNTIDSIGYNGIDFGGSYAHADSNFIRNTNYWFTDGGGIYTSGDGHDNEVGWTINNNIVLKGHGYRFGTYGDAARAFAVYLDEEKMRGQVLRNVGAYFKEGGMYGHKADSTEFAYNLFALNDVQLKWSQDDETQPVKWLKNYNNVYFSNNNQLSYLLYNRPNNSLDSFFRITNYNIIARPSNSNDLIQVLDFGSRNDYYSLNSYRSNWATRGVYTPYETNSTGAPARFNFGTPRLEYNASKTPRILNFDTGHIDIYGAKYLHSVTIPPYSAVLLVADTLNDAPTGSAGAPQTIQAPTSTATLTGSGSDPDGSVTFFWTQTGGIASTISSPASPVTGVTGLTGAGTRNYLLTITDNYGEVRTYSTSITVNTTNSAPWVNAGADIALLQPQNSATLSGSANDPDGSISAISWTLVAGLPATLTGANGYSPTITGLVPGGSYTVRMTVTDNQGLTSFDDVILSVAYANRAPIADAGQNSLIYLPLNTVVLRGANSYDPDGQTLTYSWSKISGGTYSISSTTVNNPTLSNLSAGVYAFRLTVTDTEGASNYKDVIITVSNPPTKTNANFKIQGNVKVKP